MFKLQTTKFITGVKHNADQQIRWYGSQIYGTGRSAERSFGDRRSEPLERALEGACGAGRDRFKYREYKEALKGIQDALELLDDKSQADLHELAKEELKENEEKRDALDLEIHKMLIPKDPNDGKNVILESARVRAARKRRSLHRIFSKCT